MLQQRFGQQKHWTWWLLHRPMHSLWWFHDCPAIRSFQPQSLVSHDWRHCRTNGAADDAPFLSQTLWHFGVRGMVLPGQGIGVESVSPGSPAASAQLQPGMVLRSANGISLTDASAMNCAISQSRGVLFVEVQSSPDRPTQRVKIQMLPVQLAMA